MIKIKLEMKDSAIAKLRDRSKMSEVIDKAFQLISNDLNRNLQLEAAQANFKNTSGAYVRSIHTERKRGYLKIYSDHPAAMAIEYGFKEDRPMTWLVDANTPTGAIAFKTEDGKTIIAKVTPEMIGKPSDTAKSGKSWTYPKMEGKFIFTKALKKSTPEIRRHLGRIFKIIIED